LHLDRQDLDSLVADRQRSLAAIVRLLVEAGRRRNSRPVGSFATQACRLLASDLLRKEPLTEFAHQMQLSPDPFRRRFTTELGMSPARYRLWCSIQEAQRLLAEEDLPIKAVARRLGFSSPSHLARCFAKLTGTSPAAWRRQGAPVRMPELTGSTE
jgi:AraC family transcriptional regulator